MEYVIIDELGDLKVAEVRNAFALKQDAFALLGKPLMSLWLGAGLGAMARLSKHPVHPGNQVGCTLLAALGGPAYAIGGPIVIAGAVHAERDHPNGSDFVDLRGEPMRRVIRLHIELRRILGVEFGAVPLKADPTWVQAMRAVGAYVLTGDKAVLDLRNLEAKHD